MKTDFSSTNGLAKPLQAVWQTRHAYSDRQKRNTDQGMKSELVLQHVIQIRKGIPRLNKEQKRK
jgi:hypothetical protein